MYRQLTSFLRLNGILVEQQSGFCHQHSTETALLSSTNEWLLDMDRDLLSGVIFLDLKKAFDTADHHILLSKLELNGVKGTSLKWFKSYLSGRKQTCSVNSRCHLLEKQNVDYPSALSVGLFYFYCTLTIFPDV